MLVDVVNVEEKGVVGSVEVLEVVDEGREFVVALVISVDWAMVEETADVDGTLVLVLDRTGAAAPGIVKQRDPNG